MFIAFTNFDKLKDVNRRMELKRNSMISVLSENLPFLILSKNEDWIAYETLPENFKNAAAIISFDFDGCMINEFISQNLTDLLTGKYFPYAVVIHHTNQHEKINNLIKEKKQRDSGYYSYQYLHEPKSEYKIVIDLLLDAPQPNTSNHKFVHDKTKTFRTESIGNDSERVLNALQDGEPMKNLPPILSMHDEAYRDFLKEIGGNYNQDNIDSDERWEKLKKIFKNDEYIETN